ncbi:EthD domain-containing protein [Sphingomonas sp. KC8]|uniref:EthD domain-containing protein n=1 Tax=Sphingomonas sp. KC8 TaxID=1030157 RepID=UPI0002488AC9|nr:EthD domain-containing protein [Sphingomonas sp. KC8]ARS29458.1 hypothetical protein KC8_19505 [Sphingomonas sp. KC8]
MLKFVTLLKRRPGMSIADFRDYYERHHARIGVKYLSGFAHRYMRRYIVPMPNPVTGVADEPDHDVVMEIWFPDRGAFDAAMERLGEPAIAAEIAADEDHLFDRAMHRHFFVDEYESPLRP